MGWDSGTITVYVSLDRHGDDRQERDDKLYEELKEEIRKVIQQPKYAPIVTDSSL